LTSYLDASIIVPLLVAEPTTTAITAWIGSQNTSLLIGRLAVGEAASAISRRRRMAELSNAEGEAALAALDAFVGGGLTIVDHTSEDIARAGQMVRIPMPKLIMGDAIHVATCRRLGLTLVTNDATLLVIAAREGVQAINVMISG
jgi:uncharacterized protein